MRRGEKEIRDTKDLDEILRSARVCRIGFAVDNVPYIVPVSFAHTDGSLYIHSAKEGRKIDMLRRNPRVCFEVTSEDAIVSAREACSWGASYRCVMGTGVARILEKLAEKQQALDLIMLKYSGETGWVYDSSAIDHTCIIRVDIDEMTGKQSSR
jgi:uncharacterized protein